MDFHKPYFSPLDEGFHNNYAQNSAEPSLEKPIFSAREIGTTVVETLGQGNNFIQNMDIFYISNDAKKKINKLLHVIMKLILHNNIYVSLNDNALCLNSLINSVKFTFDGKLLEIFLLVMVVWLEFGFIFKAWDKAFLNPEPSRDKNGTA